MACPPFETQVVAWWRLLVLLAAAMFSINAHAARIITGSEARSNMHVAAHSIGLELEHDLSIGWPLEEDDEHAIRKILGKLNECGDSEWRWEDESAVWSFAHVKKIAGGPRRNLALHMLNRHGLAARIAAMHEESFNRFLHERGYNRSVMQNDVIQAADLVTEALEEFPPVKELLELFKETLSLSGMRNMHSYDHSWALRKGFGKACSDLAADKCVLQAGISTGIHQFMHRHSFTEGSSPLLTQRKQELVSKGLQYLLEAAEKAAGSFRPQLLVRIFQPSVATFEGDGSGVEFDEADGNIVISGMLIIKEDSASYFIKFPVSADDKAEVEAADTNLRGDLFVRLFQRFLDTVVLRSHNEFMQTNRFHMWAGEIADFAMTQPTEAQWQKLKSQSLPSTLKACDGTATEKFPLSTIGALGLAGAAMIVVAATYLRVRVRS